MLIVNMLDAKTHLSKLVRFAEKLDGKRIGIAKGRVEIPDDIDAGNAEIARFFGVGQ